MKLWAFLDSNGHFRVLDVSTPAQQQKITRELLQSLLDRSRVSLGYLDWHGEQAARDLLTKTEIEEQEFQDFLCYYTQISLARGMWEEVELEASWSPNLLDNFY